MNTDPRPHVRRCLLTTLAFAALAGCAPGEIEDADPGPATLESTPDQAETPAGNERRGIGAATPTEDTDEPISIARQALTINGITTDPRKSLMITDQAILASFPLQKVLDQLAKQSGVTGLTGLALWKQWWQTANASGSGPLHCSTSFNGFPYACPRIEGNESLINPFLTSDETQYVPTALVNRFDLAATDGSDCGEYRIVYARRSGADQPARRNLLIFEAVLANPNPTTGLAGCRPVQLLWQEQSRAGRTPAERAAELVKLYFTGMAPFLPVVHIDNYGVGVGRLTGQIRTNSFMQGPWTLREFKLKKLTGTTPALRFEIATDKTNPGGTLFNSASTHALKAEFDTFFPTQVKALATNDINTFGMAVTNKFNTGDSPSQGTANDYRAQFGTVGSTLRGRIQQELMRIGSSLTPDNIVARATALSCGGCHQLATSANLGGGLTFPVSAGFVHVTEALEMGPDGLRFGISDALSSVFLPHRQKVMENFLTSSDPAPRCSGTAGQWAGCRGLGCWVCAEKTVDFPYYFANHPLCEKNTTCAGSFFTCNASCPAPTSADKLPTPGTCNGTAGQWNGCRGNGCAACSDALKAFPKYFANHPRCARNDTCAGQFFLCNSNCPRPTDADK